MRLEPAKSERHFFFLSFFVEPFCHRCSQVGLENAAGMRSQQSLSKYFAFREGANLDPTPNQTLLARRVALNVALVSACLHHKARLRRQKLAEDFLYHRTAITARHSLVGRPGAGMACWEHQCKHKFFRNLCVSSRQRSSHQ